MDIVLLFLVLTISSSHLILAYNIITDFSERVCENHFKDGQHIIGGIVNVYENRQLPCDGILREQYISLVEAIAYAVDSINKDEDLLPNIDLGFDIRTDCNNEDITLWTTMTLAGVLGKLEYANTCPHNERQSNKKVVAVVGPGRSSTSVFAAKVGRVFAIPIISASATSDDLSNTVRFPFFFRTAPPNKYQIGVIVDILIHFNWKYIGLFYSLDSYGIDGARQVSSLAEKMGICVAINMPMSAHASPTEIKEIADKLIEHEQVKVIVAFSVFEYSRAILFAIKNFNIGRKVTLLGSDGWNPDDNVFKDFSDILDGGIFIEFFNQQSVKFLAHYRHLPHNQDNASQWYKRKLQDIRIAANCTDSSRCPIPTPHWNAQTFINAVYAIAYALNATLQETNPTNNNVNGRAFRRKLYNVSVSTSEASVQFDENGEVPGNYLLRTCQILDGVHQMVPVGTWDSSKQHSRLDFDEETMKWETPDNKVPTSLCIEECKPGHIQVPLEKKCCWGCQRCNNFAIAVTNNTTAVCQDCHPTHWPNENFTKCLPIEPTFPHMHGIVFILLGTAAGLGFFLVILTWIGLSYYSEHSLIKASSRQLCRVNLIGLALFCAAIFVAFLKPTPSTCVVSDAIISLAFCVSFAPILLKVNRIWRIFSLELGDELRFASNKSTVVIVLLFIAAQVSSSCPC